MKIFGSNVTQDEKLEFVKMLFVRDIIYRNENIRKVSVPLRNFLYQLGIIKEGHYSEVFQDTLKFLENQKRVVVYFTIDDSDDDAEQSVAITDADNKQWRDAIDGVDEHEDGLCIVYSHNDEDQHCWNFMSESKLRFHAQMFVQSLRNSVNR